MLVSIEKEVHYARCFIYGKLLSLLALIDRESEYWVLRNSNITSYSWMSAENSHQTFYHSERCLLIERSGHSGAKLLPSKEFQSKSVECHQATSPHRDITWKSKYFLHNCTSPSSVGNSAWWMFTNLMQQAPGLPAPRYGSSGCISFWRVSLVSAAQGCRETSWTCPTQCPFPVSSVSQP